MPKERHTSSLVGKCSTLLPPLGSMGSVESAASRLLALCRVVLAQLAAAPLGAAAKACSPWFPLPATDWVALGVKSG